MRSEESPLWICFSPPNGQRDQSSSQQRSHQYLKVGGMISTSAHTHTSPALQNTIARKHNPICATGLWNNEPMGTRGLLGLHHLPLWRSRTCPNPWEFCKLQYSPSFSFDTILRGDPSLDSSSLGSLEFLLCKTRMVAKPLKTCWWKKARTRASYFGAADTGKHGGQKGVSRGKPLALPALPEVVSFAFP